MKEVLSPAWGNPEHFLSAFAERGCYLDDLVLTPVDGIPMRDRIPMYQMNVSRLAARLLEAQPVAIVSLLRRIARYVEQARLLASSDAVHHSVPFPGCGQQANFRRRMQEIIPLLPSVLRRVNKAARVAPIIANYPASSTVTDGERVASGASLAMTAVIFW